MYDTESLWFCLEKCVSNDNSIFNNRSDLLDSCLDCSDDKFVFLLNRLTCSGSGKRSRLQKTCPFWWFLQHLEKERCFRCKTLHSPRHLLGATWPGLSSALHPACQALGGITMFRLFLVAWEGQLTLLWLGSRDHRQVTWLIFLRNNLWLSILIWSEAALLKAKYGKAGGGLAAHYFIAWKECLTRCLVRV